MTRKIPREEGENSIGPKKKESSSGGSGLKSLEGEVLDEFRQSVKKKRTTYVQWRRSY